MKRLRLDCEYLVTVSYSQLYKWSRSMWLKKDDSNSDFFHASVKSNVEVEGILSQPLIKKVGLKEYLKLGKRLLSFSPIILKNQMPIDPVLTVLFYVLF